MAYLLGRSGATKQRLANFSGARLEIDPKGDDGGRVQIIGTEVEQKLARLCIDITLQQRNNGKVGVGPSCLLCLVFLCDTMKRQWFSPRQGSSGGFVLQYFPFYEQAVATGALAMLAMFSGPTSLVQVLMSALVHGSGRYTPKIDSLSTTPTAKF